MNNTLLPIDRMSPDETFEAVHKLKKNLEINFVTLGQLFSEIKKRNLYRFKGYETFREFVETEYNINSTLAVKLASVYELYVHELDMDDNTMQEIGFERLNMIKPYVNKSDWKEREAWLKKAGELPVNELKSHIKELKKQEKLLAKNLKDVFIEQYLEKMRTWFNCSTKELNFKLALYFQDTDLEHLRRVIKEKQRQFEMDLQNSKEE